MKMIETDRETGEAMELETLKQRLGALRVMAEYHKRSWLAMAAILSNGGTVIAGRFSYHYERGAK